MRFTNGVCCRFLVLSMNFNFKKTTGMTSSQNELNQIKHDSRDDTIIIDFKKINLYVNQNKKMSNK